MQQTRSGSQLKSRILSSTAAIVAVAAVLTCPGTPQAETGAPPPAPVTEGTLTPITSSIEGMISNRHQKHSWLTPDGSVHVLVAGDETSLSGLRLFSSHDSGATWEEALSIAETAPRPKADGILDNQTLYLLYPPDDGSLALSELEYDDGQQRWRHLQTQTIFKGSEAAMVGRATLALDSTGRLWVGATRLDLSDGKQIIAVGYVDEQSGPRDAGVRLGTSNLSERKSVRLVGLSDRIGAVYTDGPDQASEMYTLNWAYRQDDWPNDSWEQQQLLTYTHEDGLKDRHGAHFSVATDSLDNVHIVTTTGGSLVYIKVAPNPAIPPQVEFIAPAKPYVQITVADDDSVYLVFSTNPQRYKDVVMVARSLDWGESFDLIHCLVFHPTRNLGKARLETPARIDSKLPVFRQATADDEIAGLVYFEAVATD